MAAVLFSVLVYSSPLCASPVGWQMGDEFCGMKLYLSSDLTYFAYTPSISSLHFGNFH